MDFINEQRVDMQNSKTSYKSFCDEHDNTINEMYIKMRKERHGDEEKREEQCQELHKQCQELREKFPCVIKAREELLRDSYIKMCKERKDDDTKREEESRPVKIEISEQQKIDFADFGKKCVEDLTKKEAADIDIFGVCCKFDSPSCDKKSEDEDEDEIEIEIEMNENKETNPNFSPNSFTQNEIPSCQINSAYSPSGMYTGMHEFKRPEEINFRLDGTDSRTKIPPRTFFGNLNDKQTLCSNVMPNDTSYPYYYSTDVCLPYDNVNVNVNFIDKKKSHHCHSTDINIPYDNYTDKKESHYQSEEKNLYETNDLQKHKIEYIKKESQSNTKNKILMATILKQIGNLITTVAEITEQ